MPSSSSNNSCRRRWPMELAPASPTPFVLVRSTALIFQRRPSFIASAWELIHDPRAHLHQPMQVPKQLTHIAIFRTRYPDSRKAIFHHQLQQQLRIFASDEQCGIELDSNNRAQRRHQVTAPNSFSAHLAQLPAFSWKELAE